MSFKDNKLLKSGQGNTSDQEPEYAATYSDIDYVKFTKDKKVEAVRFKKIRSFVVLRPLYEAEVSQSVVDKNRRSYGKLCQHCYEVIDEKAISQYKAHFMSTQKLNLALSKMRQSKKARSVRPKNQLDATKEVKLSYKSLLE